MLSPPPPRADFAIILTLKHRDSHTPFLPGRVITMQLPSVLHTHGVEIVKCLVHADYLVVQLVVAAWGGQERVSICNEHVEQVNHLRIREESVSLPC